MCPSELNPDEHPIHVEIDADYVKELARQAWNLAAGSLQAKVPAGLEPHENLFWKVVHICAVIKLMRRKYDQFQLEMKKIGLRVYQEPDIDELAGPGPASPEVSWKAITTDGFVIYVDGKPVKVKFPEPMDWSEGIDLPDFELEEP